MLPRLVSQEHLVAANSLNALNNNISRLIGPPIGGMLLGLFGLPVVVIVDSLSFLAAALMIGFVAIPPQEVRIDESEQERRTSTAAWLRLWREWLAGLQFVTRSRFLTLLFLVMGIATLADGAFNANVLPFINEVLRAGPQVFGWLLTLQGIGGLIGGFVIGHLGNRLSMHLLLSMSLGVLGVLTLLQASFPSIPLVMRAVVFGGLPVMGWGIGETTLLQTLSPDTYRGRVLGAASTTTALLRLAGIGLSAALADAVGIVFTLGAAGIIYIFAGLLALISLRSLPDVTANPGR